MDNLSLDARTAGLTVPAPATPSLTIAELNGPVTTRDDVADAAWDAFVAAQPSASAYHFSGWPRLISRVFGHETRLLASERSGTLVGVLPLVVMRSRVFGRFVVSLPYLNAGGLLASDPQGGNALVERATVLAREIQASYLELRHGARLCPTLLERRHKVAMSMPLQATADRQWDVLDRKIRNQVRKAEKSGLTAASGGAELLDDFYDVFARNMRDLGTPVFPARLFEDVLKTFPESTQVFCVRKAARPVAGAIVHRRGAWCEVIWASALREFNPLSANVFLYWQMIRAAIAQGCQTFEFGRCTPGEGTFHFKKQWGAEPRPLVWEYWTPGGTVDFDASPKNPKYARAVAAWRHLPLSVTIAIGPRIVAGIPC